MGESGFSPVTLAFGIAGLGVLTLLVAKSVRMFLVMLALMLFVASLAPHVTWEETTYQTWLLPLQMQRSIVFIVFGAVLLLGVVFQLGALRGFRFPVQAWFILAISLYAAMLRFVHDGLDEGLTSLFAALLVIPTVTLASGALVQTSGSVVPLARAIAGFGLLWIGASFVQFVLNRSLVITIQPVRFIGMSGNPQNAAIMLAPLGIVTLWLGLHDYRRTLRPFWWTMLALVVILLLWTGSRTGILMLMIGGAFTAYGRLGGMIFVLPVLGVLLAMLLEVVQAAGIELATERLTHGGNTRADRWRTLWRGAMENPVFGAGQGADFGSENSVLFAFASYGIVELLLVLAFIVYSGFLGLRLFRLRRHVDRDLRAAIDLFLAYNGAYFVGSIFEGYIISRVSVNLVLILVFAAVGSFILREAAYRAGAHEPEPDEEYDDEPYGRVVPI